MSLSKCEKLSFPGECIDDIIVFPLRACLSKSFTIFNALELSSPDVGSSNSNSDGSVIISTPIAVLFLSPPEMNF